VSQQFLDGANVGAVGQQMSGEGVAEGVAGGMLLNARLLNGVLHSALDGGVGAVMAANGVSARVFGQLRGGEDVLPAPLGRGVGILFRQGVGQIHAVHVVGPVFFKLDLDLAEVAPERVVEAVGEDRRSIFAAFAVAHEEATAAEVQVFDAEAERFGEAQATSVQKMGDEAVGARRHGSKQRANLVAREDGGQALGPVGAFDGAHIAKGIFKHSLI